LLREVGFISNNKIRDILVETGRLQNFVADSGYPFDIWNSHIFIVASQTDIGKVDNLLVGTFREIEPRLGFIELGKVEEIYRRKKDYLALEE